MKNKKALLIILVIALVTAINIFFLVKKPMNSKAVSVKTSSVVKHSISDTLLASGVVVPKRKEAIYADHTIGEAKSIVVQESQTVTTDTILFSYDIENIKTEYSQLELGYKKLLLQKEQLQEKKIKVDAGFKNQIREANNQAEQVEERKRQLKEIDKEAELTELELKENNLRKYDIIKKETKALVKSPINGIVKKINSVTDVAAPLQTPLIEIYSNEPYRIIANISEYDSVHIHVGMKVKVKAKTNEDLVLTGKVEKLEMRPVQNLSSQDQGVKDTVTLYPLFVALDEPNTALEEGYHVSMEIEVTAKEKALIVPIGAVVFKDNAKFVLVVRDHRLYKQAVEVGMMNETEAEISSGLTENDKVILQPKDDYKDGMEVTENDSA